MQFVVYLGVDEFYFEQFQIINFGVYCFEYYVVYLVGFYVFGGCYVDVDFSGGVVLLNDGVIEVVFGDGVVYLVKVQVLFVFYYY